MVEALWSVNIPYFTVRSATPLLYKRVRMNIPSPSPAVLSRSHDVPLSLLQVLVLFFWRTEGGRREYSYQLAFHFVGLQLRRLGLRPPGVKLRPPGTLVVPLEGPGRAAALHSRVEYHTRPTLALPFWRPKPHTPLGGLGALRLVADRQSTVG